MDKYKTYTFLFITIFFISFTSASIDGELGLNLGATPVTPSNVSYYNNTFINQTVNATVNTTQFDSNNPIHIKESWLTNFIENIIESYNYLTETQADSLYCKLTGCTMTGNINMNNYNITNVSNIKIQETVGACDLTTNHSICSNSTGTYIIG